MLWLRIWSWADRRGLAASRTDIHRGFTEFAGAIVEISSGRPALQRFRALSPLFLVDLPTLLVRILTSKSSGARAEPPGASDCLCIVDFLFRHSAFTPDNSPMGWTRAGDA